jgi:hypothetical protein
VLVVEIFRVRHHLTFVMAFGAVDFGLRKPVCFIDSGSSLTYDFG